MGYRPTWVMVTMLPGLLAPLGCASWSLDYPPMAVPQYVPAAPTRTVSNELSADQAALLCLTTARGLEKQGYLAEAVQQYEKARAYNPGLRTVSHRLAVLYDLKDETRHAETEYLRALREQPSNAEVYNDVGYFHYRHGHLKRAEEALRHAVALNPTCRCAWVNLGEVLAKEGRAEESYRAFARVLRPAEACSNVGVLLAKQGRTNEARNALRQAVALDPTLEQPRAFLRALPAAGTAATLLPPSITHDAPPETKEAKEIKRTSAAAPIVPGAKPTRSTSVSGDTAADFQGEPEPIETPP